MQGSKYMHYACLAGSYSPGTVHEGMHGGPGTHPYLLQLHQSTHLTHLLGGPHSLHGTPCLSLSTTRLRWVKQRPQVEEW